MNSSVIEMTPEERTFQYQVLTKYREDGIIPSLQHVARLSGTAVGTVAMFMNGNSRNQKIREYIIVRTNKNFKPLPNDLKRLFEIWARDTE